MQKETLSSLLRVSSHCNRILYFVPAQSNASANIIHTRSTIKINKTTCYLNFTCYEALYNMHILLVNAFPYEGYVCAD